MKKQDIGSDLDARIIKRCQRLLDKMDDDDDKPPNERQLSIPQEINAVKMVAQVRILQANLRKAERNESDDTAGSAVRRYAQSFSSPHAAGRGKDRGGRAKPAAEPADNGFGIFDEPDDAA